MSERIFISGIGLVTPFGVGCEAAWEAVQAGRVAYGPLTEIDTATLPIKVGGWIPEELVKPEGIPNNKLRGMGKYVKVGILAAQQAVAASGLDWSTVVPERAGAFIATGTHGNNAEGLFPAFDVSRSAANTLDLARLGAEGIDAVHPWWLLSTISNNLIFFVTHVLGIKGPNSNYCNSATAGNAAIDCAFDAFRRGDIDVALVGGADCPLNWQILSDFSRLEFLAEGPAEEVMPWHPFENSARGTILADAGAFLVLETESGLQRRGGKPLAQLADCRMDAVSTHQFLPDPAGQPVAAVFEPLLRAVADVPRVAVHPAGIGHPHWDAPETRGIATAFAAVGRTLPLSALKPALGHTFSVSVILETAWAALRLAHSKDQAAIILSQCFGGAAGGVLLRDV